MNDDVGLHLNKFTRDFMEVERSVILDENLQTSTILNLIHNYEKIFRTVDPQTSSHDWCEIFSTLSLSLSRWAFSEQTITSEQIAQFVKKKRVVVSIYTNGADYRQNSLLRHITSRKYSNEQLTKILLLLSINNLFEASFHAFLKAPPLMRFWISIGWLSERTQMTLQSKMFHQRLIDSFDGFGEITIEPGEVIHLLPAYMNTSYSASQGKDKIKETMHDIVRSTFVSKFPFLDHLKPKSSLRKKPKLLIIHEKLSNTHVMLRCYGAIYRELEDVYLTHHLSLDTASFEPIDGYFKNLITCDKSFDAFLEAIMDLKPDIIYYPSIGMSAFALMLASFRLAPIQLQSFGHPSSSHSKFIDGSLCGEISCVTSGLEKYHTYPGFDRGIPIPFNLKPIADLKKKVEDRLRTDKMSICVNAKVMKLNYTFLQFLKEITQSESIELSFFPAEYGADYFSCKNFLTMHFPNSRVHHISDYETYMSLLAEHDLAICPFPFGNTNGILDCVSVSVPTLVLRGSEVCSHP